MATAKLDEDLFRRLRATGLRKKVAGVIAERTAAARKAAATRAKARA